jgi:hypothetical protein
VIATTFRSLSFAVIAWLMLPLAGASAASLPAPTGEVVLTVSGNIANTNEGKVARFDRAMLEAIGTSTITTMTPWYDHVTTFEGVSMKALLDYLGAEGSEVVATALNDYRSAIPMADFETFDVLLAMKRDGELMPIRDKGPLFIVYPYDSDPQLSTEQYYSRSVWQVKELEIR